jgi:Spy/CpxP family protein refolding chaperone
MNRLLRISLTSALVLGALAAAAPSFAAPPIEPGKVVQPAPAGGRIRAHKRTRSVTGDLLGDALNDVTLRPEQRAQIDAIKKEAGAKHAAVKKGKKALLEALAAQIGAGKFDAEAMKQASDELMLATMDEAKTHRHALDKLHALLDKKQRAQLAAAIETRMGADDDKRAGREEMRRLTDILKLTPEQQKKMAAVFGEDKKDDHDRGEKAKSREQKMLEAFKSDKYDADKVLPMSAVRASAQQEVSHLFAVVKRILPVLTPEQRVLAADLLIEHANGSATLKL